MKKAVLLTILSVLISGGVLYAYDDGDFQVWNTDIEEIKIGKNLKFALEEEFRWGDNAREFFYHHYDAGVSYLLNKFLGVGGGYRRIYELKKGKFEPENEPYITATLYGGIKGVALESRSRMEYRNFNYKPDSWRYRNKFSAKLPWKFSRLELQPYVADEIFASFASGTNQFNQNRLSSGILFKLTSSIKAEIYYMLNSIKNSGKWTDANVLGTKFKITF
ncbi:MAG: DUF2490 domain-containing protein [Candidatus Omnitrophica bacterium]|nr:DUF2490 domain-containing protein [Candidatus Omnitrophota bacterium]